MIPVPVGGTEWFCIFACLYKATVALSRRRCSAPVTGRADIQFLPDYKSTVYTHSGSQSQSNEVPVAEIVAPIFATVLQSHLSQSLTVIQLPPSDQPLHFYF